MKVSDASACVTGMQQPLHPRLQAHTTCSVYTQLDPQQNGSKVQNGNAAYQEVLLMLSSNLLWKNRGAPSLGLYTHWWYCSGVSLPTCAPCKRCVTHAPW